MLLLFFVVVLGWVSFNSFFLVLVTRPSATVLTSELGA